MHIYDKSNFTQGEISTAIQIWNRVGVSLLDIRHNLISPKEALRNYRLPASAFLYTSGNAEVQLNDIPYHVDRFGLFHGGKGTELTIMPQCDWLEYYMILYKEGEPPFHRREFSKLMAQINPFRQQYGFQPGNAIFISELLRNMYEKWKGPTPLNLFYGKSAFYQLVYSVYEELERGTVVIFQPDSIAMAKRYLEEHFGDEISMQELCRVLDISYSFFYKSFKDKIGISPQEYLIQIRLSAAKRWLQNSDMPMRMIAEACGFADERSFYRLFAKRFDLSPNTYRQNSPASCEDNTIGNAFPFLYNGEGQVSLDEFKGKGATTMFRQMRNKAVVAAALSLMLLMSACGTAPGNTSNGGSAPSTTVTSQVPEKEETRIVKTEKGDVEVPANPKRVIVDGFLRGDVLALGVTPIATESFYNAGVSYEELTKEVQVLEKWEPEYLMNEEPDLILTCDEDKYEDFSKIAPTVYVSNQGSDIERLTVLAEALGKGSKAGQTLVDAYTQKIAEAKEKLRDAGFYDKTISVIRTDGANEIGVRWGNNLGGQILYGALELPKPKNVLEEIEKGEKWGGTFSLEAVGEYMGDYILVNDDAEGGYSYAALTEQPVWQAIPAVQAGNLITIPSSYLYFYDIYSKSAQLDLLVNELLKMAEKE